MIYVLNNLIADINLRFGRFPVQAQDLLELSAVDVGPGGACNVAIMAARFGLAVGALGEVGVDRFGRIVLDGLAREGIGTAHVVASSAARTPVAGVLVDAHSEPAYLGYQGHLTVRELIAPWRDALEAANALFVDGWIEYPEMAGVILDAVRTAAAAGVPVFFDPGPGNPRQPLDWHKQVAAHATVVLLNGAEATRLTGLDAPDAAGQALRRPPTELVVVKRGARGCVVVSAESTVTLPAFPVTAVDATGAGDSVAGAVLFSWFNALSPTETALLVNATGAAKVQKFGTGHNLPTLAEVRAVLDRFDHNAPPTSAPHAS